jgi:methanogenic corrinoid protein MtbC1
VIIGGAVITEDFADRIHTHFGKDALEGVRKINELMRKCR